MSAVLDAPTRTFTAEQRAAIDDRSGSSLLAANAGSGKTAVMVERFVEAVLSDGVPVAAILALTFTEKAAGELRERIRRRFAELGEDEHARTSEGAAIGTIHGFCAGVLRAHPFAAGLDPRFTVLDEGASQRLHDTAYGRAVEAWARAEGEAAVDLLAAARDDVRQLVFGAFTELRSRGERFPRLPIPPARSAPDPAALRAALRDAAACLAGASGKNVEDGQAALEAATALLAALGNRVPYPAQLNAAKLGSQAKLLKDPACDAYRAAWEAYRQACADYHARPALVLTDKLLAHFEEEAAELKAARAAVDFEDLQLLVRDLFASDDGLRQRWTERYALIMVDEFQDTNRLQMDILGRLERANLFVVGDAFQSIYGFRHADVEIFRERARVLGDEHVRRLTANFRSRAELLSVINSAFEPIFGPEFAPLVAGRDETPAPSAGQLFDPDHLDGVGGNRFPPVELLITDTALAWDAVEGIGLEIPGEKAWRRAEARLVAQRLHEEVAGGRRPGEIAVLVRAASSLRLLEHALEEHGLPTYVVGGRGYWSQEQVRDGIAYLQVLANPLEETALYAVLASPFAGIGASELVALARSGHESAWEALKAGVVQDERVHRLVALLVAERERAERLPAEVLLERAIAATGYDIAVLARPGGERRLANLRKLMRLARDYERSEGRDLRAFLIFAQAQDLSGAREGEAALEGDGLDAVRLMTIHRAKGLEFPVVCVADLGRLGPTAGPPLLLGADQRIGLRLKTLGAAQAVAALDYATLNEERIAREDAEERRLLYVAMTRAQETLILSGGYDMSRRPEPRPGGAPIAWIVRAVEESVEPRLNDPVALAPPVAAPPPSTGTALPAPATLAAPPPPVPVAPPWAPKRLSFSSLGDYGQCPYRWYLSRVLGLPRVKPPEGTQPVLTPGAPVPETEGLDPLTRGSLVHTLLEDLDFARPAAPGPEAIAAAAAAAEVELTGAESADVARLVAAFADSPLCARLSTARVVRREAPFAFALDESARSLLVNGIVDVLATETDGSVLIVDYKTNPLGDSDPEQITAFDYAAQRLVYGLAALRNGAPSVEVAHCYLERPDQPATVTYKPADAPGLTERLVELSEGLITGEFTPTATPHRELCGSCPGREALCSHPEEFTLSSYEDLYAV